MIEPQQHLVLVHVRSARRTPQGIAFSGFVEACGEQVVGFKPGDEVRGTADEMFADYVRVASSSIIHAGHD